jgi:hypothetical protein
VGTNDDPYGLRPGQRARAEREKDGGPEAFDPSQIETHSWAVDQNRAEVIEMDVSCPAPLPCLGRTGVRFAVPRLRDGEVFDEITAVQCRRCRAYKVDERETL